MISLELINQINRDDEEAIQDAYAQLAEELRGMKLDSDFSDINARYDALNEINGTDLSKLNELSPEEIDKMAFDDGRDTYWFQKEFIKDRHPEWNIEDEEDVDVENSEEDTST